eukprot:m.98231 g.98231  ORF g.98231 m.98231 type:complete len:337 (-) comp20553_c0_seq1:41-1051(-)
MPECNEPGAGPAAPPMSLSLSASMSPYVKAKMGISRPAPDPPYMLFMEETRNAVHKANEGMSVEDVVSTVASMWRTLSPDERQLYVDKLEASGPVIEPTIPLRPPKRPINPYFHFAKIQRPTVKKENPGMSVREIVSLMSAMWRALPLEQRQPYMQMTAQDKARYARERETFVAQSTAKPVFNKKRKKKEKLTLADPNRVKRVCPAYIFFANKHRRIVMNAHPHMTTGEVSKVLGQMWHALPLADREDFFALHEQDKIRHANELQARLDRVEQGDNSPLQMFQLAMTVSHGGALVTADIPDMAQMQHIVHQPHIQQYTFPAQYIPTAQFSADSPTL